MFVRPFLMALALGLVVTRGYSQAEAPDMIWQSSAVQFSVGAKGLTWALDGGLLLSNGRRGGGELDYLTTNAGVGLPQVYESPTVSGDGGGYVGVSSTGSVVATVYSVTTAGGGGGSDRILLRILSGMPPSSPVTVELPLSQPLAYPGSFGVCVLADGLIIRAWGYSGQGAITRLFTYSSQGIQLSAQDVQLGTPVFGSAASRDGRTLVLHGLTSARVFTLGSGLPMQSIQLPVVSYGFLTCSGSGDLIAWGSTNGWIPVSRRSSIDQPFSTPQLFPTTPAGMATAIDLSTDGTVLALGLQDLGDSHSCRQQVFSMAGITPTLVSNRHLSGPSGSTILVTAVDAGEDGSKVAFGTTGSLTSAVPEVEVLRRAVGGGYGSSVAYSLQLPGSCLGVALSSRDNQLAVLSSATHVDQGSGLCTVALYDLDSDLRVIGQPQVGHAVEVQVDAAFGRRVVLYRSNALATPAVYMGGMGELHLAGPSIAGGTTGAIDGIARFDVMLAAGTFVPGTTHHFQALRLNPRRLTEQTASFTVVP